MDEAESERLRAIEDRLDRMEARFLAALEGRMNGLESRLFPASPAPRPTPVATFRDTPPPPPVMETETIVSSPPPIQPLPKMRSVTWQDEPSPPTRTPAWSAEEEKHAELRFGKLALPLVATVLIAIAMISLASELIQRGILKPPVQFALCVLATISLLGIGRWAEKKEPRAGQLLTGLGALGGYLTTGAGYSTFHVYSDQVALGLFFAWAMGVIGYGFARESKPFALLGLLGGIVACYGARTHPDTALALDMITFAASSAVAYRRRWPDAIGWTYAAGAFALWIPATGQPSPVILCLVQAAVATFALMKLLQPPDRLLSAIPAGVGVAMAWAYAGNYNLLNGGWVAGVIFFWGVLAGWVAYREKDQPTQWAFGSVAFVASGLMAPGTLPLEVRTWIWLFASAVAAGFCFRRPSPFAAAVQIVWMGFLLGGRVVFPSPHSLPDAVFWTMLTVLHFALYPQYLKKPIEEGAAEAVVFLATSFPLIAAASGSLLMAAGLSLKNSSTLALATATFSMMAVGFRTDRLGARYAAWVGLTLTVGKFIFFDLSEVDPAVRIAAMFAVGTVAFLAGAVYARRAKAEAKPEPPPDSE
ncbi:hypothetical protein BH11ARM2_BH11ARM2_21010 [soil metagenome]